MLKRRLIFQKETFEYRIMLAPQAVSLQTGTAIIQCVYEGHLNLAYMPINNGRMGMVHPLYDDTDGARGEDMQSRLKIIASRQADIYQGCLATFLCYFRQGARQAALAFLTCMARTRLIPRGVDVLIAKRVYAMGNYTTREDWWAANDAALPTWNTVNLT